MEITRYRPEHRDALIAAIGADPAWAMFTNAGAVDRYAQRLRDSVTYVCHDRGRFCGYLRALLDDGFALYISELFVVPAMRGRRIGGMLMSRLERDFAGLTVYALSDEDGYYERLGHARVGSVFEIRQRPARPDAPRRGPGRRAGAEPGAPRKDADRMHIVEARPADDAVVLHIEGLAFGRDDEPRLVAALLRDPTAQPSLSLLAYEAGRPVGHVLLTRLALLGASRAVPCAILAPLAVIPRAQRQGVGRALIERGAGLLAGAGVQLLFVLGDPAYYTRCGFVPATPHGLHAPYPIVPEAAWMVRALAPGLLGSVQGTVACADSLAKPEYWRE
jgi:putative acetyltransferase